MSISEGELALVVVISVLVLAAVLFFYRELFYIGFDENAARISGVSVRNINFLFTILTAADSFHCVPYSRDPDRFLHAGSSGGVWDADGKKL